MAQRSGPSVGRGGFHRGARRWLALGMLGLLGSACASGPASHPGRAVTLEGEIIDPQCYFTHGARGVAHRPCALYCAQGGQDLSFLNRAGGRVYPIIASGHGRNPNDSLLAVVGYPAVLMGRLYEKDGQAVLTVDRIRRLDGGAERPPDRVAADPMPHPAPTDSELSAAPAPAAVKRQEP